MPVKVQLKNSILDRAPCKYLPARSHPKKFNILDNNFYLKSSFKSSFSGISGAFIIHSQKRAISTSQ